MRQAGEVTYTTAIRIEVEKEWLSSVAGVTWSMRWTSWTGLNWVAGGSGLMRKARAGEGPGPDPGLGLAQGGAGIAPGQDLVPGQSLAPGVAPGMAPGIVPGPDPGRLGGTVAEAAHRLSARSKLGRNN